MTVDCQRKLDWIKARLRDNHNVFLTTYGRSVKIVPRRLAGLEEFLRVSADGHLMLRQGRAWVVATYMHAAAQPRP